MLRRLTESSTSFPLVTLPPAPALGTAVSPVDECPKLRVVSNPSASLGTPVTKLSDFLSTSEPQSEAREIPRISFPEDRPQAECLSSDDRMFQLASTAAAAAEAVRAGALSAKQVLLSY